MHELTGMCFDRLAAQLHCEQLEQHRAHLKRRLGRDPGMQVAALDYMVNVAPDTDSQPVIIDREQLNMLLQFSRIDSMTGLYNLCTFQSVMEKELALAKRNGKPLVLIMADLDNFKTVNDSEGHQSGDDVLRQVAEVFSENLRAMDIAGRYGGDEFIFGLPETDISSAIEITERIREKVEAIFSDRSATTLSIGLASYPGAGRSLETLITAADKALYEAKSTGKNRLKAAPSYPWAEKAP
ncbi:diguanylate cyclase [Marinobacter sp. TBZ242]|uniref:diguanylate cyclase n=1 Tax=Marinobacter azerbaijanicus TaxID=3050455 RepID=A0ABT7IFS4_9GAMM|nr:diguanylate cyclase [Marinobacter sp. TBZ242]MDL0433021.1 diguanylate cyclase [Marinobacter sp. TBZ242]